MSTSNLVPKVAVHVHGDGGHKVEVDAQQCERVGDERDGHGNAQGVNGDG